MRHSQVVFESELPTVEPGAATLYDMSRYKSHGAITGAVWTRLENGLYVLDYNSATPDSIAIPDADSRQMDFTSGVFSGIARVRFDGVAGHMALINRGVSNASGWEWINIDGRLYFYTNQVAAQQYSSTALVSLVADTRYTLGFTRDGNSVRLYVNGVDGTTTVGNHIDPVTAAVSTFFGVYNDGTSWPFDGQISFLGIYKYALTAGQHLNIHEDLKRRV